MIKKKTMSSLINSINWAKVKPGEDIKREFIYEERETTVLLQFTTTPTNILEAEVRYKATRLVFQYYHSYEPISEEVRENMRYNILRSLVAYALLGEGGNIVKTTQERNEQRKSKR
jgi:hypothetical protein